MLDQPENETKDTVEGTLSASATAAALGTLIEEVEAALSGSQELDIRIHYAFRILGGHDGNIAALLTDEGVSSPTVEEILKEIIPPYSTSLDAALLGEEIVFAIKSSRGPRWGAMQRTASGGETLAWAATEPMARRLAALKSWHVELIKLAEDDANSKDETHVNPLDTPNFAKSGVEESPIPDKLEELSDVKNNKERPDRQLTDLNNEPERTQRDNPENSDKEEKDWEILF